MEPMTLGSPVGSPSTQNPTSPYLPGFLMGDPMPQPSSPSKTPRQVHFAPNISSSMPTPNSAAAGSASINDSLSRFHKNQREKSGGPPTVGLFDTLEVSNSALSMTTPPSTPLQQSNIINQQGPSSANNLQTPNTHDDDEADKWITVFGFPPAAASSILGQFSQVGHIVEHRFPGQGNWVNICYSNKLDARRALSYNGKVLGGHTMIGVIACRDYNCSWRHYSRKQTFYFNKPYIGQPLVRKFPCPCMNHVQPGSALRDMTNVLSGNVTPSTPKSLQVSRLSQRRLVTSPIVSPYHASPRAGRPLNIASPTDNEVVGSQNTPTKSSSFVTRAVDLVFGW